MDSFDKGDLGDRFLTKIEFLLKIISKGKGVLDKDTIQKLITEKKYVDRFKLAFTTSMVDKDHNNEILEKVGDKIFDAVIQTYAITEYKDIITRLYQLAYIGDYMRSNLIFIEYMRDLGLSEFVLRNPDVKYKQKIFADAFEAFLAALQLNVNEVKGDNYSGFGAVYQLVEYILHDLLIDEKTGKAKHYIEFSEEAKYKDPSTLLKEYHEQIAKFDEDGGRSMEPQHSKKVVEDDFGYFTHTLKMGSKTFTGIDKEKKGAKRQASEQAVRYYGINQPMFDEKRKLKELGYSNKFLTDIGLSNPSFSTIKKGDGTYEITILKEGKVWIPPKGVYFPNPFPIDYELKNLNDLEIINKVFREGTVSKKLTQYKKKK